jgi:diguanylate cyclase (GGDEF) domain
MANERGIKIYNYTVGIACIVFMVFTTIIRGLNVYDIPLFIILTIASITIDRFKIQVGRVTITLITIIELSSFLIFGVMAAAWIQLVTIFVLDYQVSKRPLRTVMLNIGMILTTVFAGGIAYNTAANIMGNPQGRYLVGPKIIPAVCFMLAALVVNYLFIYVQFFFIDKNLFKQILKNSIFWELISMVISLPVALAFTDIYISSAENNLLFAILLLMPIIFICFIFSLMRKIVFANRQLKALSRVALTINSYLDLDKTYNSIIDAIGPLVSFTGCYIFETSECGNEMTPAAYMVDSIVNPNQYRFSISGGLFDRITKSTQPIIINDLEKELSKSNKNDCCNLYKSCILVPMRRLNKCVGCIGVFSDESHVFTNEILEFLMILSDQATIAIENAKLFKVSEEEAITDGLTCLYNQRYFYNCLGDKIKEYREVHKKMSLMIFDIDYFKRVNDTYGHTVGDFVLKEVADLIKSSVRKDDIVARYGGEEFTVILPELDSDEAYVIAERIRNKIEEHIFAVNDLKIKITISGGISEYPRLAANDVELVNYADRAMYVGAKFRGRNRIKIYDEKLA